MHGAVRTLMIGVVALAALHYAWAADNESGRPPASAVKSVWDTVPWKSPRVALADHSSHRRWANSSPAATVAIAALSAAVENALLEAADTEQRLGIDLCRASYVAFDDRLEAIQRIGRRALAAIPAGTAGGPSAKTEKPSDKPSRPSDLDALSRKIDHVLAVYSEKHLNTAQQSPWEMMHRIVAFGIPTEIRRDGPDGPRVNAIGWLLWGGRCNGMPLMVTSGGAPMGRVGPGLQGHPAQFLGMLAQSGVSPDSPFQLEGKSFTVADLIEQEKLDCNTHIELTFKLIALSYYLKSDETWRSRDGQQWSVGRLAKEEIQLPLRNAACGGTHRLFGLSSSYIYRAKRSQPIDGEFQMAQKYIRDYQRYTLHKLQNPDGSLSTDWFDRPANASDVARKIQTTGHMLEWLAFSLPKDELRDPQVIKSVEFIASTLDENTNRDWSVGPLGHALHALAIYNKRAVGAEPSLPREHVVERQPLRAAMAPTDGPTHEHHGPR
jgi:hypothetical protein